MVKQSLLLVLLLFILMVIPTESYNFYDEAEESTKKVSSSSSPKKAAPKVKETDIGIGKVRMNQDTGNYDGDAALAEFTLAAGSHINLRLWQFIVWQLGFVLVGMCLCGFSVLIYNKCCSN